MSVGGDGDDDIREIKEAIRQIQDILSLIVTGEGVEEISTPEDVGDNWSVGENSVAVSSVEEYRMERQRAANDEDISRPFFVGDIDKVDAYLTLYLSKGENLNVISLALSDDDFDEFMREFAILELGDEFPEIERIIDILNPDSKRFGVIDEGGGNIDIHDNFTPFGFMRVYGSLWYIPGVILEGGTFVGLADADDIQEAVGIEVEWEDIELIDGGMEPRQFVESLVLDIVNRDDLIVPDDIRDKYLSGT